MTFLSDVANHLLSHHRDHLGNCTVVFPNRRAGLFLKKELASKLESPIWSPTTLSLEDFLLTFSSIKKADPLTLVFELYQAFKAHQSVVDGFESFYHWGEMLLRDFEEVDHYMVEPKHVFTLVKDERELAENFYFLDEEQEKIIQKFWSEFLPVSTKTQEKFVETWKILLPVYDSFKKRLSEESIGYTSHIYRSLAENTSSVGLAKEKKIIFAGFNALTPVEEYLIKYFISKHGAEVVWDVDDYYLENLHQEAGTFFRKYLGDPLLKETFPKKRLNRTNREKQVELIGVSLEIGQAKLINEKIQSLIKGGARTEEIVVVLPQEYMLFPVLNAIPDTVEKLNVTMGYPLKDTPLYGLLEAAIELQEHAQFSEKDGISFYHKPVLDILSHPFLYGDDKNPLDKLISDIKNNNQIRIHQDEFTKVSSLVLNIVFKKVEDKHIVTYLLELLNVLSQQVVERFGLEREYVYHFQLHLTRLREILKNQEMVLDIKTFKGLFKKSSRTIKIPFSGEPVNGLQIMGVLETRNLDFKHIFMLNMNEGTFPNPRRSGSFIPYRVRKAFGLSTHEVQDAIFAYLFYRLFHHATELTFCYNTFADFGLSGEVSRFLRQYDFESGQFIHKKKLSNSIQINETSEISIETTEQVLGMLSIYTDQVPLREQRRLSASAINTYFDCKLRFYFRYVLQMFTKDKVEENLDARHFGNVLHKTLELLYLDTIEEKGSRIVDVNDFFRLKNSIDGAIEKAFKQEFGVKDHKRFNLKDRNVVMAEVIRNFTLRVLELDEKYAPFQIVNLEGEDKYEKYISISKNGKILQIKLGANIDRVDLKDGTVRVLDYKTGKDETEIGDFENVFNPEVGYKYKFGRKAGFQTFFYAWLFASKMGVEHAIVPGIVNIKQIFKEDFDYRLKMDGRPIEDSRGFLDRFESRLQEILGDIFDQDVPFTQTEDETKCIFCDFKGICNK